MSAMILYDNYVVTDAVLRRPLKQAVFRAAPCINIFGKMIFSPKLPAKRISKSKFEPYKSVIQYWIEDNAKCWRKQHNTTRKIWQRLRDKFNANVSRSTARRYATKLHKQNKGWQEHFLDLVWEPGQTQTNFGEAYFYIKEIRDRLSFFVLVFPCSNIGFVQVFPDKNAKCIRQALKQIFEYTKGVSARIVFDNATSVGHKLRMDISALFPTRNSKKLKHNELRKWIPNLNLFDFFSNLWKI